MRSLLSIALLSVLLVFPTPAQEFFPLSEVRAGQQGVGKTVFQGTQIEEFGVEILGVLENVGPKQSLILARLSGPQIDGNAQLGVSQLNTTQDPFRDPFHVYAHKFSVFVPAWVGASPRRRKSLEQLIQAEKPGHTAHQLIFVEPRFRIGIQSMDTTVSALFKPRMSSMQTPVRR